MIVACLKGGLGNQLFQYAAARRLANARGAELRLDVSGLDYPGLRMPRRYELGALNVVERFAKSEELVRVRAAPRGLVRRLRARLSGGVGEIRRVREAHYHFDPTILELPNDVHLDGYWQSERYFADVADLIRKEVTPMAPLTGQNALLAREIGGCEAVSVHVRRSDYLTDPEVRAFHPACEAGYYARAAEHVVGELEAPVFFVFGDDPDWFRAQVSLPGRTVVVDHNGANHPAEDLRLMGLCHHHVIANSTFSWWGAWLNPRPDKRVVAPERWFGSNRWDTRDLIPEEWVRL